MQPVLIWGGEHRLGVSAHSSREASSPSLLVGWFWDEPCYGANTNALVPTASQTHMLSCKGDMRPTAMDQGAWMGLPGCVPFCCSGERGWPGGTSGGSASVGRHSRLAQLRGVC